MKNITIGPAGPDWKLAASARYYAERGDGEDYAFGKTPAEALANLEEREASKDAKFDESLSEEVAFLALGAADYLRENKGVDLSEFGGYMGIIGAVVQCAPLLERRWSRMKADEFDGVWLYDVTERFGHEWAESLLTRGNEDPEDLLECIVADEMEKWKQQVHVDTPDKPRALNRAE